MEQILKAGNIKCLIEEINLYWKKCFFKICYETGWSGT